MPERAAGSVVRANALETLRSPPGPIHLTFLDPPFNQGRHYDAHDDDMPEEEYWAWMEDVCRASLEASAPGAALYFMQREKNAAEVLGTVRAAGWDTRNLIVWKKKTSAVPVRNSYNKAYQVLAFAAKGAPRIFNELRIDPPLPAHYTEPRERGVSLTDVWDDIREMTSGYFAGEEALRGPDGKRIHKQQAPVDLLLRVILASTLPGDLVVDPFAGTGTAGVVAGQLGRRYLLSDNSGANCELMRRRIGERREADRAAARAGYYRHTPDLERIWPGARAAAGARKLDAWLKKRAAPTAPHFKKGR
jgi:site-specific DNA-methyltransferase (adenine-specific)